MLQLFLYPLHQSFLPQVTKRNLIHQDSTDIDYEKIQPTQEKLIQELKLIVEQIDKDKVFVDDVLRSKLEPIQHQLEILSDLAKPRSPKPKYI